MKRILLFLFAADFLQVSAQITITSASMPVSGDTIRYSNTNPNSINTALTGANYYWNFDSLQSLNQGRYDYLKASLTPYSFYFLGVGQYGLKTADSIGAGTFKFYEVYQFYKKTTAAFMAEGIGFKYQNVPLAQTYSDDDEIYSLPLTYLRHDSTTFAFTMSLGGNISYSQKGYRINDVDGWGVVKTPHDSVNCLRLVSTLYETDSINYNGIPFVYPNPQRQFKWMTTTEHIPVLEVDGSYFNSSFTPTIARYRDSYINSVGIAELKGNDHIVIVYPNPTRDFLLIKTTAENAGSVEVYDMNGKLLVKAVMNAGFCLLDVRNIPAQACLCKVLFGDGSLISSSSVLIQK
jgi:hypothetical protein